MTISQCQNGEYARMVYKYRVTVHVVNMCNKKSITVKRWCSEVRMSTVGYAEKRRGHWGMAAAMTTSSLAHSVLSRCFVQLSDACFVHLLLQYFPHAVVKRIQIWRIGVYSWGGIYIIMIIIIMLTFIIRLLLQNKNIGAVQKYKNLEFL